MEQALVNLVNGLFLFLGIGIGILVITFFGEQLCQNVPVIQWVQTQLRKKVKSLKAKGKAKRKDQAKDLCTDG